MPKRTSAIKKTDLNATKPWLKKVGLYKYKVESREKKKTFLIVCEGQTEELYFRAFPVLTADVKPIHQGCTKSSLVECTKSYLENENYDEVWCVFDMDFKAGHERQYEDFDNAITAAVNAGFKCAYSNDAFELWFLLHYQFINEQHNRNFFYKKLGEYWNINYERAGKSRDFSKSIYSLLNADRNASQTRAILNAEKQYKYLQNQPYHLQNPVTKVYELVRALNTHLRK